jgi:hypothetical protein
MLCLSLTSISTLAPPKMLNLETGNVTFYVPRIFVPRKEHGNNLVPIVLKPNFSSVPHTTLLDFDPIDPRI